jgi:hypothetical protein
MFSGKNLFASAALIFTSFLGVSAANAAAPCFTLASLQGSYSLIGTYGANVALALATGSFDGNGNLTATFIVNEPTAGSTTGERTIVTGSFVGTYTVNCNGTGTFTRVLNVSGVLTNQVDDFVIAEATSTLGGAIATRIVDAQRTPSAIVPGGIFLTRTWTRLPDAEGPLALIGLRR